MSATFFRHRPIQLIAMGVCIKIINILANRCCEKQKICKRISVGILDHAIIILTLAGVPYTLSDDAKQMKTKKAEIYMIILRVESVESN